VAGRVAQVVELLPNKCEALDQTPVPHTHTHTHTHTHKNNNLKKQFRNNEVYPRRISSRTSCAVKICRCWGRGEK
jgi:hypothetical protein